MQDPEKQHLTTHTSYFSRLQAYLSKSIKSIPLSQSQPSSSKLTPSLSSSQSTNPSLSTLQFDEKSFEIFGYSILLQIFVLYLIYLYFDQINQYHPLVSVVLLGGHTSLLAQSLNQYYRKIINLNKNFKFYLWGVINGLMTSFWISFLVENFETGLNKFLVDQTFGALGFQCLFTLYNIFWERLDLRSTFSGIYFKALKYSYMIWPFVSFVSFNVIENESVLFPLNCFCNLVFTVLLSLVT